MTYKSLAYNERSARMRLPQNTLIVPGKFGGFGRLSAATAQAGTANQGYYQSFVQPYSTDIISMSVWNQTGTNNADLGLYDATGTLLGSKGSTASVAASLFTFTPSVPIPVQEGVMYFAAFATAGTATILAFSGSAQNNPRMGRAIQASALALPSPATFAAAGTTVFLPIISIVFAN